MGRGSGRFSKDGATVVELSATGDLLVVPETEQLECMLCEVADVMHVEVLAAGRSQGCDWSQNCDLGSTSGSTEPVWMRQHQLEGHSYDKTCPWCVQGKLKQRQQFRQLHGPSERCQEGGYRSILLGHMRKGSLEVQSP